MSLSSAWNRIPKTTPTRRPSAALAGRRPSRPTIAPLMIAVSSGSPEPYISPNSQPNNAISRALLRMRSHSGLGSAGRARMLVNASTGANSTAPRPAPWAAPTPPIASPSTAPDAAPSVAPQISASTTRPERLRLRRSGSPITGEYRRGGGILGLISYDQRDGAGGAGGQTGWRESRHWRGISSGAGTGGSHHDPQGEAHGRDETLRPHGRRS